MNKPFTWFAFKLPFTEIIFSTPLIDLVYIIIVSHFLSNVNRKITMKSIFLECCDIFVTVSIY